MSKRPREDSEDRDDSTHHFEGNKGDVILERWEIIKLAGVGTFGRVFECWDIVKSRTVAIKIIRAIEKYAESAKIEASILEAVNAEDRTKRSLCVEMYECFEFKGHFCLVFEPLGTSLYDFLKTNRHYPFPFHHVRHILHQLLHAINFLHTRVKLTHTDLKLENLLAVNGDFDTEEVDGRTRRYLRDSRIKLIDFGGATFDGHHKSRIINTRQYRAPEVILGLGWNKTSDLWSCGCIAMELYAGELLFGTHDNAEHLALMERMLGRFPRKIGIKAWEYHSKYFDKDGYLRWPELAGSKRSAQYVKRTRRLQVPKYRQKLEEHVLFFDLVLQLLDYSPRNRITAYKALQHPLFADYDVFSGKLLSELLPAPPPPQEEDDIAVDRTEESRTWRSRSREAPLQSSVPFRERSPVPPPEFRPSATSRGFSRPQQPPLQYKWREYSGPASLSATAPVHTVLVTAGQPKEEEMDVVAGSEQDGLETDTVLMDALPLPPPAFGFGKSKEL